MARRRPEHDAQSVRPRPEPLDPGRRDRRDGRRRERGLRPRRDIHCPARDRPRRCRARDEHAVARHRADDRRHQRPALGGSRDRGRLHAREARGHHEPDERAGNDDGARQDACPANPGQPGACHQPEGASGVARGRRGRGRVARLRRDRDDGRRGPLRAVQCAGDPRRLADRPRWRPHAMRGRGSDESAPRLQGPHQLFRNAFRLRDRARVRRRRRHAVVEGVPRRRLREPRRQDTVHVRRRRTCADGLRGRQVDAVPRGAQPARDAGRREPRRPRTARSAASRCRNRCPTDCAR